jgi:putative chitinase
MFESLFKSYMSKVSGEDTENNFTPMNKKSFSFMKKTSDNFSVIKDIAKNIKESNEKIVQLVEIMGGQPKKDLSGDYFEEQDKKEEQIEASRLKPKKEKPKAEKKEKFSIFKLLRNIFETILKTITTVLAVALAPAILIGIFVDSIKEMFLEFGKKIKDSLVEFFDGFVEKIQTWITDTVKPIIDGIKEFIDKMVETVSNFFGKIGDWFVEKFGFIKDIFEPVLSFISKVWDKFTSMLDGLKAKLKPLVEAALNFSGKDGKITKLFKSVGLDKFVGIGVEPKQITKEEDDAEKKKLERQQKEALDAEKERKEEAIKTERVRKQEQEKQYTGEDEIVRKRLGIEEKTKTMREEERKKTEVSPQPETKPSVTAAPTPSPAPTPEKKEEKPLEVSGVQATIVESLKQSGIESPKAHANVLATVKAESNFKVQSENLNYSSPDRIQGVFGKRRIPSVEFAQQFVKNPEALANHVYKTTDGNSAEGDGFKYRGRGFIQHTGKNQYAAIAKFTGVDTLKNPDALNSPEVAAKAIPWFLLSYKRMKPEDVEDMSKVNKAIAFADPTGQKALAREKSAEQIYASMSGSSGTQVASASSEVASGQRQQQKPSTPVVVNAPTTNTTVVNNKQVASALPPKDSSRALVSRAA